MCGLFPAQGNHGVDAGGAAGGDVTGGERDDREKGGDGDEGDGIASPHAKKQTANQAGEGEGAGQAQPDPRDGERHPLPHQEPRNMRGRGAEREANAEFARALGDQVRHYAIYSDGGESQREKREEAEHNHRESAAGQRVLHAVVHGAHVVNRQVGIDLVNFFFYGGGQRGGRDVAAQHDVHGLGGVLRVREIKGDARIGSERVLLEAADHADNGQPGIRWVGRVQAAGADAFADGILARPILLGEILVDDGDFLSGGRVEVAEETATAQRNLHGFEIVATDDALVGVQENFAGRRDATFNRDRAPGKHFAEWQRSDGAGGGDAGDAFEALIEFAVGGEYGGAVLVALAVGGELEREHAPRLESR